MIKLYNILPEHVIKPKFNLSISSNVRRQIRHIAWRELSKALIKQIKEETKYFDLFQILLPEANSEVYDITSNFVKEYMIAHHSEFKKGDQEILASPNSINSLTTEDIEEYIEDTPELKRYLTNLVWKYILSKINIKEEIEVLTAQTIDDLRDMVYNRPDAMLSNLIRHAASVAPAKIDDLLLIGADSNTMKVWAEDLAVGLIDTYYLNDADFAQYLNSTLQKSNMLGEHVIRPGVRYKFKVGQKVQLNVGDENAGTVLRAVPNFESLPTKVKEDPSRYVDENSRYIPWYFCEFIAYRHPRRKSTRINAFQNYRDNREYFEEWIPEDELDYFDETRNDFEDPYVSFTGDDKDFNKQLARSKFNPWSDTDDFSDLDTVDEHVVRPKSRFKFEIDQQVGFNGAFKVVDRRENVTDVRRNLKGTYIYDSLLNTANLNKPWYLLMGPTPYPTQWWIPEENINY